MGLKFKRQKPIGRYIVDFVCLEHFRVIELDGGQHMEQAGRDRERDEYLVARGYRVLRFWNHQVLGQMEAVLERIRLEVGPLPTRAAPALSRERERGQNVRVVWLGVTPRPLVGEGLGERGEPQLTIKLNNHNPSSP